MRKLLLIAITAIFIGLSLNTEANNKEKLVLIKTNKGDIKIKLYNETPVHRDNFIKLVEEKFYDSVMFHRVIKDFMVQGGDPDSKNAGDKKMLGSGGPGYTLPAEILPQLFHKKGALCAARQGDQMNPQRRSSGSQFYIVHGKKLTIDELEKLEQRMHTKWSDEQKEAYSTIGGTPFLDAQYTVFGEVVEGIDIVDAIATVETLPGDRPKEDVIVLKMEVVKK